MKKSPRVLVVDDDPGIRFFLSEELALAGYEVWTAAGGEEALRLLPEAAPDLILLDLKMGGMDGLQVLEEVVERPLAPAVVILTAYASLDSAIGALRRGAVDYLVKPCTTEQLLAGVARGLARREDEVRRQELIRLIGETVRQLDLPRRPDGAPSGPAGGGRFLEARGLILDRERLIVTRLGKPLALTPTEFRLLAGLMEHADRPLALRELARLVHGTAEDEPSARQALSTHLWRLRRKLGRAPDGADYIANVRGRGYVFRSQPPRQP